MIVTAIQRILEKANLTFDQIDLIEINEAFAPMSLLNAKILSGGDPEKMKSILEKINMNERAIAIGHP